MIEHKNYSGNPDPDVGGETEFFRCNFTQPEPVLDGADYIGTRLFPGDDTPRTFTKCNLVNCEVPPGSTIVSGNTTIRRSLVVSQVDELEVDGFSLPVNVYVDIIYGRQVAPGVYDYYPEPVEIPNDTVVE